MELYHHAKILIVDDERLNLISLKNMLETAGYAVETALSGKEALEKIEHAPPNMLLLDVMMPEMNGFEVARKIKTEEKFKSIPIIMMTGSLSNDAIESRIAGADDVLAKPIVRDKLLPCIKSHLKKAPLV